MAIVRHDESLIWSTNPQWSHITVLRVPPNEIYIPDIRVYNDIDFTTKKMVDTNALIYSNGMVMWVPPMTTKALCKLDLKKWPFDEHICSLKFGSWTYDGYVMDVKAMSKY